MNDFNSIEVSLNLFERKGDRRRGAASEKNEGSALLRGALRDDPYAVAAYLHTGGAREPHALPLPHASRPGVPGQGLHLSSIHSHGIHHFNRYCSGQASICQDIFRTCQDNLLCAV